MTRPPTELRLPVLTGRAWTFADNLAASDILPERFAALAPDAAAAHLFARFLAGTFAAMPERTNTLK